MRKLQPSTCLVWFNLNDLVEGFWAFAQPGGLWWEVDLGGFGESFYSVIACFYGNGNNLKVVFSSSVRGEVSTRRYLCHDGLTVSGTCLRRIRDVDMKRDFAFVVRISSYLFSLFLTCICAHAQFSTHRRTYIVIYFCCLISCHANMIFYSVFFSLALDYRNLVTLEMLMMQDIA